MRNSSEDNSEADIEDATTKIRRHCSSGSLQSLEEIVTCSIHLGLLVDPRLLPCGHAFCRGCIEECLQRVRQNECWRCPLCRQICNHLTNTNVPCLPRAGTHNYVMQYIANRRFATSSPTSASSAKPPRPQRTFSDSSYFDEDPPFGQKSRRNSIKGDATVRAEILQQMIQDLTQREEPLGSEEKQKRYIDTLRSLLEMLPSSSNVQGSLTLFDQSTLSIDVAPTAPDISAIPNVTESSIMQQLSSSPFYLEPMNITSNPSQSVPTSIQPQTNEVVSPFSSAYDILDMDTIRKNMKRHSRYRVYQRISANVGDFEYRVTDVRCADLHVDNTQSSGSSYIHQAILLNANTPRPSFIFRQPGSEKLRVQFLKRDYTPVHMQCHNGHLYILVVDTSDINNSNPGTLHIILCTPELHILKKSRGFPLRSDFVPSCGSQGFYLDIDRNQIFLPLPWESEVVILNAQSLQEQRESLHFDGHHPSFITCQSSNGELWLSCPKDGTILIFEEHSEHTQKLGTDNIYSAVPSDIITTSDGRVIFLDSHQNRLFWIRKRHGYILVQRLDFQGALRNCLLTGLRTLNDGRMLVVAHHGALLAKPQRTNDNKTNGPQSCTLI